MRAARMLVRAGLVAVPLLAVAAGAAFLYYLDFSPDRGRYPVRGIDVSHHQGAIDWPAVAGDDVAFVYIKATEGGDFVDADFAANWNEARAAGLLAGAYHFFTFCRTGAEQAENVVATVPGEGASLPLVVDLEFGGNRPRGFGGDGAASRGTCPQDLRGNWRSRPNRRCKSSRGNPPPTLAVGTPLPRSARGRGRPQARSADVITDKSPEAHQGAQEYPDTAQS